MMFDLVSKEFWLHHLAVCFAFVVFVLSVNAKLVFGEDQRVPRGLSALTDLANLPLLRTGTWLTGTDSHDVTGGNNDGFEGRYSYLYKDGDEYVLFEENGPGCIYVVRTIGFKGDLKIYLDGAAQPQYTFSFPDIYLGGRPPFISPLVAPEQTAHGSSWSYVPICFSKGCKLTTDEMGRNHFFNIFCHKFANGTAVGVFEPGIAVQDAAKLWLRAGENLKLGQDVKEIHDTISIARHSRGTIVDIQGEGAICSLKIKFPNGSSDLAAAFVMKAYWDGELVPQIDSPLSSFFALGCPRAVEALKHGLKEPDSTRDRVKPSSVPPRSLVVGEDKDGWLYCYFPMPFWRSARIDLMNVSSQEAIQVEYVVGYSPQAYPANSGYFHAKWRQENPVRVGEDYVVMETRGHGHYVGCVLTMSSVYRNSPYGKPHVRGYLEGDARLYIDDSRAPIVASTGTEEYFNWGWYDLLPHDVAFSYPIHGYPVHAIDDQDHTVMYRFHLSDLVPYYRSFKFELEHGGDGRAIANYSGTAFYYQRNELALVATDELDVGDEKSEQEHQYACKEPVWQGRRIVPYEGSYQIPPVSDSPRDRNHNVRDDGRAWTESCSFVMKIDPKNAGVKIRRRSFYGFGAPEDARGPVDKPAFTVRQCVQVSVDGKDVGEWHISPCHARATWLETDFEIPKEVTQGKDRITVTLTNKLPRPWDEYTYWIYCYKEMS